MNRDETLKLALEVLEAAKNGLAWYQDTYPYSFDGSDIEVNEQINTAIKSLEKTLAKQEQGEPVAYDVRCDNCGGDGYDPKDNNYFCSSCEGSGFVEKMLYTTPQQRKPLTDEIDRLRKALVYVAHALHATPQYMLAKGISLLDNDAVRVSIDGWVVEASDKTTEAAHSIKE
jgi:hypothetical protein